MIYLLLFFEFFKIGLFTFGGGYAMIPLISETLESHGWMTNSELQNLIGICESTPGPIAVNMATYIGSIQGGLLGSIIATLGVVLPSFIIILLVAAVLKNLVNSKTFQGFISGVKPVVVGLILPTGLIMLTDLLFLNEAKDFDVSLNSMYCFTIIVGVYFGYYFVSKKKIPAIALIVLSGLIGILVSYIL